MGFQDWSGKAREPGPTRTTRGRDQFARYRQLLRIAGRILTIFPPRVRTALLRGFRNTGGKLGLAVRYVLLLGLCRSLGDNVSVHPGAFLFSPENMVIGSNVSIHPMCYIDAAGKITIGDNVSIAHSTTIMSTEHQFSRTDVPINDQGVLFQPVAIDDDVWLGAHVVVLAGVRVSQGCVVGAGSVVTKDTVQGGVYVGIPARMVKTRS